MKTMRILCLVLIVGMVLALADGVWAADKKAKNPTWDKYKIPKKEAELSTVSVVFSLVFLAGVGVVAFKSAHRTHLD